MMRKIGIPLGGLVLAAFFVWITMRWFKGELIGEAAMRLLHSPGMLVLMTAGYGLSFWLKALSWRLYAGRETIDPLARYIHPLFVSLLVNHVLPVKAGDLARSGLLVRSTSIRWDDALHSVAAMRVLDMASLLLIGSSGALVLGLEASPLYMAVLGGALLVSAVCWRGLERLRLRERSERRTEATRELETSMLADSLSDSSLPEAERDGVQTSRIRRAERDKAILLRHYEHLRTTLASGRGAAAALLTLACWLLEGAVLYGVVRVLGLSVGPLQAIWVTGMTIAGQIFHITPGGIGTYETTMTASLGVLGIAGSAAYTAALLSHGYKFMFAFLTGAISLAMSAVTWSEMRSWLRLRKKEGQGE
ncbi:flippase-like domain-containing protein [Paenibacillus rhizovicinus]|uniref:Phosphatidylglycerol lysyltransferase n=1 Tax=Paenibacillus rhizovicinus TaxID=2704463 RepID=A0A6C0P251_9BACL|nr:lysylphosphatidylglycerol synthase transmembrane domain-containing protein [Paenibacillus rhizovicinus]QHW32545.1 flippase-like domain-containing protein [Paenibacillus rhizovicinus]